MKLFIDNFDSTIFKIAVYKLYIDEETNKDQLEEKISKIKKGIIFCFTVFFTENIVNLQNLGFHLISIRNTYKLSVEKYLKKEIANLRAKYQILQKRAAAEILKKDNLIRLAKTIYETSRYSKDKFLPKSRGLEIYINWVNNSLYGNYADEAFLIFNKNKTVALGIITIKIKDKTGFINLLGIIKKHQNQKLATHLLKKAITYLKSRGIEDIFVVTEGENIPANIFYQKNNFILQDVKLVYHKHI